MFFALALSLAFVALVVASGALVHRMLQVSLLDASELATKLDTPCPSSVRDWPELRIDAVVADPEVPWRVLVLVRWPAHPEMRRMLVLDTAGAAARSLGLLRSWCADNASVSPTRRGSEGMVLRGRRRPEYVYARLVEEDQAA